MLRVSRLLPLTTNLRLQSFSTDFPQNFKRFAQFASRKPTFFQEALEKQNMKSPSLKMVVMELKDELGPIPWPTFAEGVKQGGESMKEFYFHRCHEFDEVRYHQTFRRLLNGEQVAWLGTPGIGKSTGVNYILYELVANLGSSGFPTVVYYRLPGTIVMFSKLPQDEEVQVETKVARLPLEGIYDFIDTNNSRLLKTTESKGKVCLIAELRETNEEDPEFNIATLVPLSSRNADIKLKSFSKGGLLNKYLVGPPSHEQILYMEWTRYLHGKDIWYLNDESLVDAQTKQLLLPPNQKNKTLFTSIISKMLSVVGPIPRAFVTAQNYREHVDGLGEEDSNILMEAINSVNKISYWNVPSEVKYFLAPYPKWKSPDARSVLDDPPVCSRGLISWSFLSPLAERLFIHAKPTDDQYRKLQATGLNYLIAESRVRCYLKKEYEDTWEFLHDAGYGHTLITQDLRDPIIFPNIESEILLETAFINQPVTNLAAHCLYSSRVHNFRLGNFALVDHEKKICYYFQVTLKDLGDHPVKVSVLEEVMGRLQIIENKYKLHLIFVNDKALRSPSGSKFIIPGEAVKGEKVEFSLKELKSDQKWCLLANNVDTTIVRAFLSQKKAFKTKQINDCEGEHV